MALIKPAWWAYYGSTEAEAVAWLRALPNNPLDLAGDASTFPAEQARSLALGVADLERATGRWFVPATGTLAVRGQGGATLQIDPPIVELTGVSVSGTELDLAGLDVNAGTVMDDGVDPRDDPFVRFLQPSMTSYASGTGAWPTEEQGRVVELTGTFGYLEADRTTPAQVRYLAALLGVRHHEAQIGDDSAQDDLMRGAIIMEQTRGRSYQLAQGLLSAGLFRNLEIDRMISTFARPPRVYVSRSRRRSRRRRIY